MKVVAVVATFRRPRELARLLASLSGVERVVVCDNSASDEVRAVVENAPLPADYLAPGENLGCGGGLRLAEEHAWKITAGHFTHLLVLDDDAVLKPDTVAKLAAENVDAAYPQVTGPDGRIGWLPGIKPGTHGAEFTWAQGICLLVRREAVEAAGFHRADFWVRGEDLDFSLRLTARGPGAFVPIAECEHLPPPQGAEAQAEYLRHAAMVQNIAYLVTQPHGARIRRSIAGASRRFLATWGLRAIPDLLRALWRGGWRKEPAGTGQGRTFRQRFDELR